MPIDKSKYPDDWDNIAKSYKKSINWSCEDCGISHMEDETMGSCLTVHHKNHDSGNPNAELIGLCARCHLREERDYQYKLKHKNQLQLFGDE